MKKVQEKSQVIGGFLEWLLQTKRVKSGRFRRPEDDALMIESKVVLAIWQPRLDGDEVLVPFQAGSHGSTEELLAEFFGIDLKKVDFETNAIYQDLRHEHGGTNTGSPVRHAVKTAGGGARIALCGQKLDFGLVTRSTTCLKCIQILGGIHA